MKQFVRKTAKPYISVFKDGRVRFSRDFVVLADLKNYKGVYILHENDTKNVGLKFTNDDSQDIFKISHSEHSAVIYIDRFLRLFEIDRSRRYSITEKENLYVFNTAERDGRSKSAKRKKKTIVGKD